MRTSILGLVVLVPFTLLAEEQKAPVLATAPAVSAPVSVLPPAARVQVPHTVDVKAIRAKLDTLVSAAHEASKRDDLDTARSALTEALALDPQAETRAGILRGLWFVAARQHDVEAAREYRQQYEAMMPTTLTWPGAGCRK